MVTVASVPVGEFVRDALQNLNAQRQRSALALLGVMIGTASIVALMTIGHMAQRETLKLFADTGIDIVQVSASPVGEEPAVLDQAVVEALPATDPDILASAPLAIGNSKASLDAAETDVGVVGVTAVLPSLAGLTMAEGRFLAPLDSGQTVAVIGAEVATKLAANGVSARVGQAVRIGAYGFVVVGVLAPRAYTAFDPTDFNNAVLVPMATGGRVMDRPGDGPAARARRSGHDRGRRARDGRLGHARRCAQGPDRRGHDPHDERAKGGADAVPAGHRGNLAAGRRDRGDERHADGHHRAAARDRYPCGDRGHAARHQPDVPGRGGGVDADRGSRRPDAGFDGCSDHGGGVRMVVFGRTLHPADRTGDGARGRPGVRRLSGREGLAARSDRGSACGINS